MLARLSGVSLLPEADLRARATDALARAWSATAGVAVPDGPAASGEARDVPDGRPILELQTTSYETLVRSPIVAEFVERLTRRAAAADPADPQLLEDALRIGLNAFLESLP